MQGQLELFEQAKAPIYHYSLTSVWNECPTCKTQPSHIGDTKWARDSSTYIDQPERCPYCGQLLDWSDEAIKAAAKYSRDYLAANEEPKDTKKWANNDFGYTWSGLE